MDKSKITREQMSALVDGELYDAEAHAVLDASDGVAGHEAWDVYHQVGDLMRSDDMAIPLSAGFSARLAARLEAEPALRIDAAAMTAIPAELRRAPPRSAIRRFAIPGAAAAAMAIAAVVATPQLMVASGPATSTPALVESVVVSGPAVSKGAMISASATLAAAEPVAQVEPEVVLRDPHIDEYLMAHERYSPSVYSNAQFSRSATFAAESEK